MSLDPHDVSDIQDKGMQALALLAHNTGWKRVSAKGMAIYHAPNGHELRLPTNTSIRMSVFQSRLNAIFTHSEYTPNATLVNEVIEKVKLGRTHAGRLREKFVVAPTRAPHDDGMVVLPPLPEPETPVDDQMVAEAIATSVEDWVEVRKEDLPPKATAEQFAIVDPPATTEVVEPVKKEPYIVRYGRKGVASKGRALYRSNFIEVWTWPDGRKTLNCPYCGETRETANGVAIHARSNHPELIPERRSEWTNEGEATYEPSQYQDRKPSEAEETINLIRDLIGTDDTLLEALRMERDEWQRRALKAEGDIQALKELLRDE